MKKQIVFIIGLLISGFCLYLAFRGLSLRDIGVALQQADLRWIGMALIVYTGAFFFRTLRWKGLMTSLIDVPAMQLVNPLALGFFANNVLPFRMGEFVRAHVTGRKFGLSRTASLGTIVLERMFDSICFLTIFLIVAMYFPFPGPIKKAALAMGSVLIMLIIVLLLAAAQQDRASVWIDRMPLPPAVKGKLKHVVLNFSQGVSGMTRPSYVIRAVVLSMAVWICEGTIIFCIGSAFPIAFTYPQAYFLLFFLGLSVAVPQAPGYVGTMELFGATALSLLGVPKEQGLPVILALHGFQFAYIGLLGCIALWREGMSLGSLAHPSENTSENT